MAAIALGLAAALGASRAAMAAGVLDHVPADAMVVVKVSNLGATSAKIGKLAQDLGLDMAVPQLADPLGSLKQEAHITGGLDENGEMAFVLLDPSKHGGNDDPSQSMLVLIPTHDVKALTANFQNVHNDGDVTIFTAPDGNESYVVDWGDGYAALSDSRELIAQKPTQFLKPTGKSASELNENDIVVYANVPLLREPGMKAIQENRDRAHQEFMQGFRRGAMGPGAAQRRGRAGGANGAGGAGAGGNENNVQAFANVAGTAFDKVMDGATAFLRDAEGATVGFTFTDAGIRENFVADFRDGTYIGNLVSQAKGSDEPLVSGLPSSPYLVFGGWTNSPQVTNKLIDDVLKPIISAFPAAGEKTGGDAATDKTDNADKADKADKTGDANAADANAADNAATIDPALVQRAVEGMKKYSSHVDRWSFGMLTPQGPVGQEGIFQIISLAHGDNADAIVRDVHDALQTNVEFTNAMMGVAPNGGVKMEQTWNEGARKVGDVNFDSVTTNILGAEDAARQVRQQFKFMYGQENAEALIGKVSDHDVLTFIGVSDQIVGEAVTAARENQAPLASLDHVKAVAQQLPGKHVAEMYVALDEIFSTALRAGNQLGFFQGNVQLPPDLSPLGFALSTDGHSMQGSVFIPTDLVQALVSASMQLRTGRQGRGNGGL